jgi:hypothetical protein
MIRSTLYYLESLPWGFSVFAIISAFLLLAITSILVVRCNTNAKHLKGHHDVSGFVFTNLGVLYSVLLGFTVVNVQQRYDQVSTTVKTEAAYLSELYRDAEAFSKKDVVAIQGSLKDYTESIIKDEWDVVSEGKPHPKTTLMLNKVWRAYYDVDLVSHKEEILYAESIHQLNQLINTRLLRLFGGEESLSDEMWLLLIIGGVVIVVFISIFSFEALWLHLVLASVLATSTAFLLFLIYSLDTSFTGAVKVLPVALEEVLQGMEMGDVGSRVAQD